ncbi:MAG: type II toxin-antitoxin system VapC family toxin [Pirellulales bacterium]
MSYLLDTNTWISLLRWQNAGVLARLKQHPAEDILLCSVVLAELWYGAERSDPNRRADNYALINELEAKYESLPFDNPAARDYALIRAQLSRTGQSIGPNDTIIAAIARSRGATLVTHNTAEFSRVPSLLIQDWQTV